MSSEDEIELAERVLATAHCEKAGVLNAPAAVDIFGRSGLTFEQLRDIWNLADQNQNGELSRNELTMAIRLMGWAQAGEALRADLLAKPGPLPTLEGISDVRKQNTVKYPPVTPEGIRGYEAAFVHAGPVSGLLEDDKAVSAFMATSGLSYEQLLKIAKLADRDARGALDFPQFALGMYLVHAFQSCLIPSIPTTIPDDLSKIFAGLRLSDPDLPRQSLYSSTSSLNQPNTQLRTTPPAPGTSPPIPSINTGHAPEQPWSILPHEKQEADEQFVVIDVENKGYIETQNAAKFLMGYDLPHSELGRIWMLADLKRDNRLTKDEFAIVMHLLRQRLAGEPIPDTLPPSLLSPALRLELKSLPSPAPSPPTPKSKPPPPPPPKKDREHSPEITLNGRISRAHTSSSSLSSPTSNPRYTTPLSPPLSPSAPALRPRTSVSFSSPSPSSMSFLTSPRPRPVTPLVSPFEDSTGLVSQCPLPTPTPILPASPPMVERAALDSLETTLKRETGRLTLVIESLRSQLLEQGQLRESNTKLEKENKSLRSELRDMERTVSEVLSANDRLGSQEQYITEIGKLTADVEAKDIEIASTKRVLDVIKQEAQELRSSLREVQSVVGKAKNDADEMRTTTANQAEEIKELKSRLADMSKAMSEPSSATNTRELRVLLRDATKDNDTLKGKLRDTEKSMEQLLLSTKFTPRTEELQRENRRLKEQIQDMTLIAMTVQNSSASSAPSRGSDNLARENETLKDQLKEEQRGLADMRQTHSAKLVEMQQQIDSLTHENRLLKIEASSRQRQARPHEDASVPPPAYDDSFVIPP